MRQSIKEDESIMTKSIYITVKCYTKKEKSSSAQMNVYVLLAVLFNQKHDFNLFPAESEMKRGTKNDTIFVTTHMRKQKVTFVCVH